MRSTEVSKLFVLGCLFLVLLGLYLKFYFLGEIKEYGKAATTFSSQIKQRPNVDMPTVVFCMKPSVLPLMKEQYEYNQFLKFMIRAMIFWGRKIGRHRKIKNVRDCVHST